MPQYFFTADYHDGQKLKQALARALAKGQYAIKGPKHGQWVITVTEPGLTTELFEWLREASRTHYETTDGS